MSTAKRKSAANATSVAAGDLAKAKLELIEQKSKDFKEYLKIQLKEASNSKIKQAYPYNRAPNLTLSSKYTQQQVVQHLEDSEANDKKRNSQLFHQRAASFHPQQQLSKQLETIPQRLTLAAASPSKYLSCTYQGNHSSRAVDQAMVKSEQTCISDNTELKVRQSNEKAPLTIGNQYGGPNLLFDVQSFQSIQQQQEQLAFFSNRIPSTNSGEYLNSTINNAVQSLNQLQANAVQHQRTGGHLPTIQANKFSLSLKQRPRQHNLIQNLNSLPVNNLANTMKDGDQLPPRTDPYRSCGIGNVPASSGTQIGGDISNGSSTLYGGGSSQIGSITPVSVKFILNYFTRGGKDITTKWKIIKHQHSSPSKQLQKVPKEVLMIANTQKEQRRKLFGMQ